MGHCECKVRVQCEAMNDLDASGSVIWGFENKGYATMNINRPVGSLMYINFGSVNHLVSILLQDQESAQNGSK